MNETELNSLLQQIRADLRHALRLSEELRQPINAFATDETRPIGEPRFRVVFDLKPPRHANGLKVRVLSLDLYDEPIIGKTLEFAGKVWHLKDKLAKFAKLTHSPVEIDDYVNARQPLTISADLANLNKHGENRNRSGLSPSLELVRFDTSKSGVIELFLDGATKEKLLLVTFKRPIPYTVDLNIAGGAVLGDAVEIVQNAMMSWLPLIKELKVLDGDNPEAKHLRERLGLGP